MTRKSVSYQRPEPVDQHDMAELKRACAGYLDAVETGNSDRASKCEHYIFETAMELIFGADVWKFVNERLKGW